MILAISGPDIVTVITQRGSLPEQRAEDEWSRRFPTFTATLRPWPLISMHAGPIETLTSLIKRHPPVTLMATINWENSKNPLNIRSYGAKMCIIEEITYPLSKERQPTETF